MAPPEVKVVTDALRKESRMWDEHSGTLGALHQAAEGLRMTRIEAGLFQVLFGAYEDALNQVSDRCKEGETEMDKIASALIKNANAYDSREAETTESIEGTY
jgi:hypothetical protein